MKGKFARGGIILSGGTAFEIGFRFLRTVILTRILAPEFFGQMATIISAVAVSRAFTEVGIRQAIIQNKKGDTESFLNAAWWFSLVRGIVLFTIALLASPYISAFFKSPELSLPMGLAFTTLFFDSIISPRLHVLEKRFHFFKWIIIMQGPAIINAIIAVTLSLVMKSVWPLVIAQIVEKACICLFSYLFFPFRPKLSIDRHCFRELFHFTRGMFGLPILASLFMQFDIFIIGRLLSMEQLGLYSIARQLCYTFIYASSKILSPLILPVFSKFQDDPASLKKWLLKMVDLSAVLLIPFAVSIILVSRSMLLILYGPQYETVAVSFSILMIFVIFRIFAEFHTSLFLSFSRPATLRTFSLLRLVLVFILVYPLTTLLGLPGTALTVLSGMVLLFSLQTIASGRLISIRHTQLLHCFTRGCVTGALLALTGYFAIHLIPVHTAVSLLLPHYRIIQALFPVPDIVNILIMGALFLAAEILVFTTKHYKQLVFGK